MRNGFVLLACSIIWLGCASKKNASSTAEPAIRFEKTACFGTCPEFVLTVKSNGEATLSVVTNLELEKGIYTCSNCDPLQVQLILKKADEIGFSQYEDKYDPGVTDLPSVITTINDKKVINVLDGPTELHDLEEQINDAYIKHRVWKKIEE